MIISQTLWTEIICELFTFSVRPVPA